MQNCFCSASSAANTNRTSGGWSLLQAALSRGQYRRRAGRQPAFAPSPGWCSMRARQSPGPTTSGSGAALHTWRWSFQVDACRFHFCFYCCTYNQTTQRSLSKQLSVKLRFLVDLRNLYGTSTINQVHLYKSYRIKKYCRGLVYNRLSLEARGSASYGSDCLH